MENMWWTHIRKAMDFVEEISEKAYLGQSLLLAFPNQIPWANELYDSVETQLRTRNPEYRVVMLLEEDGDPETLVLEHFCRRETRAKYRRAIGAAKFLVEQPDCTLHSSYVWIRIVSDAAMKNWISFVSDYIQHAPKGHQKASFILECRHISKAPRSGKLKVIDWNTAVDTYDVFTYCALCSDSVGISNSLRPYLVELASNVCGSDVELGSACIRQGLSFLEDPRNALKRISETEQRSSEEPFQISLSDDALQSKIWESQIRVAFSVIEKQRDFYVRKYARDISACLPVQDCFGNEISELRQVELGTLIRLVGERRVFVQSDDYDNISFLKDRRNDLAHLVPLPFSHIKRLLDR